MEKAQQEIETYDKSKGAQTILIPPEPDSTAQSIVSSAVVGSGFLEDPLVTCQVQIRISDEKAWTMASFDQYGNRKNVGGDEFYVVYADESSKRAVASIEDCEDGTYILDFCTLPFENELSFIGRGTVTVHFEYSCGFGSLPPPVKTEWKNGGYTHTKYFATEIPQPPVRTFQRPQNINLNRYDLIVVFGDSTFEQFVRQRPDKKGRYFFQENITFNEKIRIGMDSEKILEFSELLEFQHGAKLKDQSFGKKALLIGSFMWDILNYKDTLQGGGFKDHEESCRELIRSVRENYPDVDILWKSPTAVHIHWVDLERLIPSNGETATLFGLDRVRYMSRSRSFHLYQLQKRVCSELDVTFLDIYEATDLCASKLYPSDGRHFKPDFNRLMLSWFYTDEGAECQVGSNRLYVEPFKNLSNSD